MKQFEHTIYLYPTSFTLTVYIGPDIKPVKKQFPKLESTINYDGYTGGHFIWDEGLHFAIMMEKWSVSLFIHESSHAIDQWFESISVENEDGEWRAYWMGYLYERIRMEYKEWKKKK